MIKKWQSFLEANYTTPNEEDLLQKYFDITSDDIKDWCQDVREMGAWLDKHKKMSFRYSVPFL